jgi:branched-chain amino acid transport system substrate-binding protein
MWWKALAAASIALAPAAAAADDTVKIGLILPMTGPFASTGRQVEAGARVYLQQNGATAGGRKLEIVLRDDAGIPENSKRIAQELLVRDKVDILAGFGLTPIALAVAPLATETKTAMVVMAAATSIVTERSPYIVRTSFAQAQSVVVIADWEARQGLKKAVSVVSDFAPGHDSESYFKQRFTQAGGEVAAAVRVPLLNPDFAPFLQRVRDASPDGLFVFVPAGQAAAFMRQFRERGLDQSGIRLFGAGDITDDDVLNQMGDTMLGTVTAYYYSAAHPSAKNKAFVEDVRRAYGGMRANFFAVAGYDGMHLIRAALDKTGGKTDGDSFIAAARGMAWESPRGPMAIDAETRDVVHDIYLRRVEKVDGELWNVEFDAVAQVKDPAKPARK